MTVSVAEKKGRAPGPLTSDLVATHVYCLECEDEAPIEKGRTCQNCGEASNLSFEHHSATPLGYSDDKKALWPAVPIIDRPAVYIYFAKDPTL